MQRALKPLLLLALLLCPLLGNAAEVNELAAMAASGSDAEVWQAIQQGAEGRTTSADPYHAQLINPYDARWLDWRTNWLSYGLFAALFGMIVVFILFIKVNGIAKLSQGFSGKMIHRWSKADVFIHWLGAIPCMLLILTGLMLLAGKVIFEPLLGTDVFAPLASLAKPVHDYMAIPFMLGWLLMTVKWARNQLPEKCDIGWILVVGGYINFGPFKGKHPHAGFANAGEKMWFWTFAAFGAVISATGCILLFPDLIEPSRTLSLMAILVHGASAIVICAFSIVHIFMATVMSEGGMPAMVSGYVDENWAIQHHDLWYEKIKANGELKYKS